MKVKLVSNLLHTVKKYDISSDGDYNWHHPNYKKDKKILRYFRRKQGKIVTVRFYRGDAFDKIHDIWLPKIAYIKQV